VSRLLYVDAVAGVAGDMLLGALLDAGASLDAVRAGLARMGVAGLAVAVERTERHGIGAAHVTVSAPHEHVHRDWAAVRELIDRAALPPRAAARAHEAFRRLAEAEGRIHGVPPDRVHFHEVGGVDAIADVCGTALALEDLGVDRVVCSPLPAPRGFVRAAHGRLPLPAPATLELLVGAPLVGVEGDAELVTPTGAALIAALAEGFGPLPAMTLAAVGYGAGTRDTPERPNLVRVLVGEAAPGAPRRPAVLVEATLDDLTPELVPDAVAACTAAGALDAWVAPVQMKKGRPGVVLTAVARPEAEHAVATALLRATTTLGVRVVPVARYELEREHTHVAVGGERIGVKLGRLDGAVVNAAPEHDDVARAAAALGRPARAVWAEAFAAAQGLVR
jgi:hypothetical protein